MIHYVYNNYWISRHNPLSILTAMKSVTVIYMFICYNSYILYFYRGLWCVCVWFTATGLGLFGWVCVLKWSFHSVPLLVWCHCGLPWGRVAPLDWWCWQSICTNRESATFLEFFYFQRSHTSQTFVAVELRHTIKFMNAFIDICSPY